MWSVLIDDALPPQLFSFLHDRLNGVDVDPFNRHSYWFPLSATPRLLVEHAIQALRPYIPGGDEVAGVEWWMEAKPPGRGVKWHFDNDHEVERRDGRQVFPVFASILYFGSIGGPTVIVDQVARGAVLSPDTPTEALVYLPRPNRFGVFAGELRHAVAAMDVVDGPLRLTMPLNWWRAKPEPPTCVEPPYGVQEFECLVPPAAAEWEISASGHAATPVRLGRTELTRLLERDNRPVWQQP